MIKNGLGAPWGRALLLFGCVFAVACDRAVATGPEEFQGVVELETRTLSFEVAGRVEQIKVEEGDHLDGQVVLAQLDESLMRPEREARAAELEAAKAQVALIEAGARGEEMRAVEAEIAAIDSQKTVLLRQRARQEQLAAQGAAPRALIDELDVQDSALTGRRDVAVQKLKGLRSGARRQEIDVARARAQALEAALAAADAKLARFKLSYAGAADVLEVHAKVGEVVAPGAPLATLADLDHPYVDVFVAQSAISQIQVGAPVWVRVDSLPKPIEGKVQRIGTKTEFTPRFLFSEKERANLVIRVRVRMADPGHQLRAGVPAFVTPKHADVASKNPER